jgi:hypothetical protein
MDETDKLMALILIMGRTMTKFQRDEAMAAWRKLVAEREGKAVK